MKIGWFGEAKSLATVPSGEIFSTILSNGRFARFLKVTGSGAHDGVYVGSIAIGPYLEDDRPVQLYSPDVISPDEIVLHEDNIALHPARESDANDFMPKDPAQQPVGSVTVTANNRVLLRFRSHRKPGFVCLDDGKLTEVAANDIVACYRHYRLTGPDEAGAMAPLFDSARPQ